MASAVEDACKAVEDASGKPVVVMPDPAMKLIARVARARGSAPAHVVTFNPAYGEAVDYHVVFQCGLILRAFQAPAAERFDIAETEAGRREAGGLVATHLKQNMPTLSDAARRQVGDQMYDGLVLQLRSVAVGLRVDGWVRDAYPGLADQQRRSTTRQLAEYQAALAPRVKLLAPEKIYAANVGMNAALASFWARELADPTLVIPYRVAGHLRTGEDLLALADALPSDPPADRELIRAWGDRLGLVGWYQFSPFGA